MINFFARTFLVALYSSSFVKSAPSLRIDDTSFPFAKHAVSSTSDSAVLVVPTRSSQLTSYGSTSSRRQAYSTSSRTCKTRKHQHSTSSGSSYGHGEATSSEYGVYPLANDTSSSSRYGLQGSGGAGIVPPISNQGCSQGTPVTSTQTVTTVVTSTQTVTSTELSLVTQTSSTTTTITAYVTTTITSTGGLNTGNLGQTRGAGSSAPPANVPPYPYTASRYGTAPQNSAQTSIAGVSPGYLGSLSSNPYGSTGYPRASLPGTEAGGFLSYPMASATNGTGQPSSANYGYGSAPHHPTTTGYGNPYGPVTPGTGNSSSNQPWSLTSFGAGSFTTSKPTNPYYPGFSPNSTLQQLSLTGSIGSPGASHTINGANLTTYEAVVTTAPISSTPVHSASPVDFSNSSQPANGTAASPKVPTTCSFPSTSTISVFVRTALSHSLPSSPLLTMPLIPYSLVRGPPQYSPPNALHVPQLHNLHPSQLSSLRAPPFQPSPALPLHPHDPGLRNRPKGRSRGHQFHAAKSDGLLLPHPRQH